MRPDLLVVAGLVPDGSRVLDLGCGDGALLAHLAEHGGSGTGVDQDADSFIAAIRRGVSVISLDIDSQLDQFADDSYDLVVVSQTLQATRQPDEILRQALRIAPRAIVSVPNFAHWKHRLSLGLRGRMPVSAGLPHRWYETPNIHLATLTDLEALFAQRNLSVRERVLLDADGQAREGRGRPNLFAAGAVYVVERAG